MERRDAVKGRNAVPGVRDRSLEDGRREQHPAHRAALLPEQLAPTVDVIGCFQVEEGINPVYRNPSHHLILVGSGCVESRIDGRLIEAKPGSLFCFYPAERTEHRTHRRTLFFQAHISFARPPLHHATPYFPGIGLLPSYLQLGPSFPEMRDQFETLCQCVPKSDVVNRLRTQAAVFNILRIIAGVIKPSRMEAIPLDPWERMRLRLGSTGGFALKIFELAAEMGVSVRHFNRTFHSRFGCGPKEYQMQSRLEEARRRLRGTDAPVKTIAYDLGFASARSMTRTIHRTLGVTPSDLRQTVAVTAAYPKVTLKRPYPINLHIVPPGTPANWRDQFRSHRA
jgi:AraC-like DNA-binding protein